MSALDKVTTAQAAKELKTTILNIQESLIQGQLPIGYAQKRRGSARYNYVIYRGLLDSYKKKIESGELFDFNKEAEVPHAKVL
jgi:hypothetical protein